MAQNNRVALRIGPKTATGALTDPQYFKALCHTGTTLAPNILTQNSEKICGNNSARRGRENPARIGFNPTGGWNTELEWGHIDYFAEGLFQNTWDRQNYRTNEFNASGISAVSSSAYTVANGTAFAQNQIIKAWGFTNEANNRVFVAQSGSGATSIAVTGGTTENSPPSTAQVRVVGLRFGAGNAETDVTGSVKTFVATGHTLTSYVTVGDWVRIGGAIDEDKFDTAGCNGWCRVSAVASGTLTFDIVPDGFATDAGTGKTIHLWIGDWLRDSSTKGAYPIEIEYTDESGSPFYHYFPSWYPNGLNLAIENTDQARIVTIGVDGFSIADPTDPDTRTANATTIPALDFPSIHSGDDIVQVRVNGAALPSTELATSLSMNITNNLQRKSAIGYNAGYDVNGGTFEVTGSLTMDLDSTTFSSYALDGTSLDISWIAQDDQYHAVVVDVPNAEFTDFSPDNGQRDATTRATLPFTGYDDETFGCTIQYGTFAAVAAPVTVDS